MQYTKPTTKEQMYTVLNDMFYYYRIKREVYEPITLTALTLTRESYTEPTEEQYRAKAAALVAPEQELRLAKYKGDIEDEINELNEKKVKVTASCISDKAKIEKNYEGSKEKILKEVAKKGLSGSSVALSRLTELENEKNAELAAMTSACTEKTNEYSSRISALNTKKSNASSYFSSVCEKEILAKIEELKDKEREKKRETGRYNTGLAEKETRYANTLKQADANLQLKHASVVNASEYSKDQLVEIGYYEDVISCVCDYYNTMTASDAFSDIKKEEKLVVYLDDYYPDVLYLYRTKAGL